MTAEDRQPPSALVSLPETLYSIATNDRWMPKKSVLLLVALLAIAVVYKTALGE